MSNASPTAAMILIGNELLSGRTQDTNLNYVAKGLNEMGIRLIEARVIPDDETVIVATVNALRASVTYVFTSGGIGPTHDDITTACVAKAFGVPMVRHPDAQAALERHYKPEDLNEARLKMADVPEGATLIPNPVSSAPGYIIGNVHVMAGVPRILQAMFEHVRGILTPGAPIFSRSVSSHVPEGTLAAGLSSIQERFPEISIGSYPFVREGRVGASLVARSTDTGMLETVVTEIAALIVALGGEPIQEGA